jgi:hypothetical protein
MKKQTYLRSCITFAGAVLAFQLASVEAVYAQGWPEAAPAPKAAVAVAPAKSEKKAANTAAPAAAKAERIPKAEIVKPAAPKPAAVVKPVAAAAAPVAEAAPSDLVQALQRQSDILARLATELQTQRTVIVEQQDKIKALESRSAATATAAAAAVTPAAPVVAAPGAAPAKAPAPAPLPEIVVESGGPKLKLGGLVQGWYTIGSAGTVDTFRLRRTEMKFSGDMSPHAKWVVMFDAAKALSLSSTTATVGGANVVTAASVAQSGRVLQDAYVALSASSQFAVELGQQKIPLSMEGVQSSGKLETIERALFMTDKARGAGWGDARDLGLMVRGKLFKGQFEYASGVFNGLGETLNDVDKTDQKDVVTRIVLHPSFMKSLQFGGSFARDAFGTTDATLRQRQGLEALYTFKTYAVKAEEMSGQDGPIQRRGGYFQVTDRIKNVQALFRFDRWDPDTSTDATAATVAEHDWLGGMTWFVTKSGVSLQFNYIHKTFMTSITPTKDVFTANLQTAW